jgi:hypothetical protein
MTTVLEKNFKGKTLNRLKEIKTNLRKNWGPIQKIIDDRKQIESHVKRELKKRERFEKLPKSEKKKKLQKQLDKYMSICKKYEKQFNKPSTYPGSIDPYDFDNTEQLIEWRNASHCAESIKKQISFL